MRENTKDKMFKFLPNSLTDFGKYNSKNLDYKNYLHYAWNREAYYEDQIFKEPFTFMPKSGGLVQYIEEVGMPELQLPVPSWSPSSVLLSKEDLPTSMSPKLQSLEQFIQDDCKSIPSWSSSPVLLSEDLPTSVSPKLQSPVTSWSPSPVLLSKEDLLTSMSPKLQSPEQFIQDDHKSIPPWSPSPVLLSKENLPTSMSPTVMVPSWLDKEKPTSGHVDTVMVPSWLDKETPISGHVDTVLVPSWLGKQFSPRTPLGTSDMVLVPSWLEKQLSPRTPLGTSGHSHMQSSGSTTSSSGSSMTTSSNSSSGNSPSGVVIPPGSVVLTPHTPIPIIDRRMITFTKEPTGGFKVLGSGVSGTVYHASFNWSNLQLAVKLYKKAELERQVIINEAMILTLLGKTGVVPKCFGLMTEPGNILKFSLVQEFFGKGTTIYKLLGMIYKDEINLSEADIIKICHKLVYGLKVIHSSGVLVNDLKSDNVLVDITNRDFDIRYIDFGLATLKDGMRYCKSNDPNNDELFNFLAPEVRNGDNKTTEASDIFSLGVLIGELGWKVDDLEDISNMCTDPLALARPSSDEILIMMDGLLHNLP